MFLTRYECIEFISILHYKSYNKKVPSFLIVAFVHKMKNMLFRQKSKNSENARNPKKI